MEPATSRVIGIYINFDGDSIGDARISRVEAMPGGHIVLKPLEDSAAMAVILNHINMPELTALLDALHCHHQKIA